jgi:hypothetical protein
MLLNLSVYTYRVNKTHVFTPMFKMPIIAYVSMTLSDLLNTP